MGFKQFDGGGGGGGGGGGTPALPFNSVQFNAAGAFGGDANLTWVPASGLWVKTTGTFGNYYGPDLGGGGAERVLLQATREETDPVPVTHGFYLESRVSPSADSSAVHYGYDTALFFIGTPRTFSGDTWASLNYLEIGGAQIFTAPVYVNESRVNLSGSPTINNLYVYYSSVEDGGGPGTTGTLVEFYGKNLAGLGITNPYYSWFDSRGVLRVKEDSAVDGGNAQSIQALYNPRFAKYTAGAANFERGVQQWNTNVLQYGAEAGGTGVLRPFELLGSAIKISSLSASLPVFTDGSKNLVSPTANAALNALLPSQTGNSGKFLTTDATNASWATISSTPAFSAITAGTNAVALVVGTGGSLTVSGSGTINATSLGGTAAASYALLAGPTFTAPVTITGVVGSSALTITGATQTASFPVLNLTQTWNNAGATFTGLLFNATSTASAATSLLMDLQVGGVSKAGFVKDGSAYALTGLFIDKTHVWSSASTTGLAFETAGYFSMYFAATTTAIGFRSTSVVSLQSAGAFGWTASSTSASGTPDLLLTRDAANTLAQRNGTNAQAARWENTYTSTTNREYATADWISTANLFRLMTVKGSGGGTARAMALGTDSVDRLTFGAAGNATFATPVVLSTAVPLSMSSGTDQRAGDTTLVGGTKTVNNTTVTANTRVFAQRKTAGGTIGMSLTYTVIAATSFTLTSDNILDTSVYSYWLLEIP